jgi:hypothetical protein
VHTFAKYKSGRPGKWWICLHPGCTLIREHPKVINKFTACTNCGSTFILTWKEALYSKPKCLNCANTKEGRNHRAAKSLMQNINALANGGMDGVDHE